MRVLSESRADLQLLNDSDYKHEAHFSAETLNLKKRGSNCAKIMFAFTPYVFSTLHYLTTRFSVDYSPDNTCKLSVLNLLSRHTF